MRLPTLRLEHHPHAATLSVQPPGTLDPYQWVAIDAFPLDNCMYHAVAVAQGIRRLLRKPNAAAIQRAVDQLRTNVARYMCNNPGAFGRLLFPAAGARLPNPRANNPLPSTNTTAPVSEAAAAAVRAGMREYCLAVSRETCHGGRANLIALAQALKKRVCVYKSRGDTYVLTDTYGPRSAPKINLLHAGSMAYMALVPCAMLNVDGQSLCASAPHWTPVRVPDASSKPNSRNSNRNGNRNRNNR